MEKRKFAALMSQLALGIPKYAPNFIDRLTLQTWYEDLGDIPDDRLEEACQFARRNLNEFPSIAWLIRKCKGTVRSDLEIGQDIAARIEMAIGAHGYTNAKEALHHIGEIGQEVVRMCGGWVNICNIENMEELSSHRKRWRELGSLVSKNFHEQGHNAAPKLPYAAFSAIAFIESVKRGEIS